MSAHVAGATQEVQLAAIAADLNAEIAFRMANRVFVVKPIDDVTAPDVLRGRLADAAGRHGYHSTAVKVGCRDADADCSGN